MEFVYLLVSLFIISAIGLGLFYLVAVLAKRIKKDARALVIKKSICNSDENCSICGGNCDKFILEVLNGEKSLDICPKISSEDKDEIKEVLNIVPQVSGNKIAHVFCKGGARAINQYGYVGPKSCDYSNKLYDGLKVCQFGCQGCMDCKAVCPTGAIEKNKFGVAEINRSLCIGCGECVNACPDKLIKLIDIDQKVVISCKHAELIGEKQNVSEFCGVGCTKCGKCVSICPTGALYMESGNLKFDNKKCDKCTKCVNVCPNSTISSIVEDFLKF